jgi:hypothetical protein
MKRRSALTALVGAWCLWGALPHVASAQWTQTAGPQGAVVTALAANDDVIYASVYDDIYRYDDRTDRWILTGSVEAQGSLHSDFTGTRLLAVGSQLIGSTRNGIIRSTDGGATWIRDDVSGALFGAGGDAYTLHEEKLSRFDATAGTWTAAGTVPPMTTAPTIVGSLAFTTAFYSNEVFRSDDGMRTWRQITPEFPLHGREPVAGMQVMFVGGGAVLYANVGGAEILRSSDGVSWENISDGLPEYLGAREMYADDDELLITTNHGLYRFDGSQWTQVQIAPTRQIAFAGERTLLATYGGIRSLADDGSSTVPFNGGLIGGGAYALSAIGDYVFASTSDGLYRTTDHGASWTLVADFASWAQSAYAEARGVLYTVAGVIYRSIDSGASWTMTGPEYDFEWEGPPYRNDITGVASLGDAVYASAGAYLSGKGASGWSSGGVFRSTDAGASWQEVSSNLPHDGFTYVPVGDIKAGRDYLLITTARGLYRSTDGGTQWRRSMNGLPYDEQYLSSMELISLAGRHYVRIGTRHFESLDGGLSWRPMSGAVPDGFSWSGYGTSVVDDRLYTIATGVVDDTTYVQRLLRYDGSTWEDVTSMQPGKVQFQSLVRAGDYVYAGSIRNGVWRSNAETGPASAPSENTGALSLRALPTPARDRVTIACDLDHASDVTLRLVASNGEIVRTLSLGAMTTGAHSIELSLDGLPAGVYVAQIVADGASATTRVVRTE